MKGLIIIPAYNEESNIERACEALNDAPAGFDHLVINDHSDDRTLQICREHGIPVIDLPVNLGIGGAVQTGYRYALEKGYDYAVQMDGYAQHDPAYLNDMLKTLTENDADMVIGSRFLKKEGYQSSPLRRVGIRYFSWLIAKLTHHTITDPTSGFRLISRRLIECFSGDYPVDYPEPESLVYALRHGYKVLEVPVHMKERHGGSSSIGFIRSVYYAFKVSASVIMEVCK